MRTSALMAAGGMLTVLVLVGCAARLIPPADQPTTKICHQGETIEISRRAAEYHLSHGDRAGACR